jgi:nicotinic acid mononucleotide adenylyltransferase
MEEKINQINKSDWKGIFIENGAGANPIANTIMNFDGSSATVYHTETPYSFELSKKRFNMSEHRAVCVQTIEDMMKSDYVIDLINIKDVNFGVFSTFQLSNNSSPTHGYIGILRKIIENNLKTYKIDIFHISPQINLNRVEFIKNIGILGVNLLHDILYNKITGDTNVDYIWQGENNILNDIEISMNKNKLVQYVTESKNEHVVIFAKNNEFVRLDDIERANKDILLFKGSFNPLHNTHIAMLKQATAVPAYTPTPYFVLSVNTMDKGEQSINSLITRIHLINEAGYDVMLTRLPRFHSNLSYINNKIKQKITFILGLDTYERLLNDYIVDKDNTLQNSKSKYNLDFENVDFLIFERLGYDKINTELMKTLNPENITIMSYPYTEELSSTKIRDTINELKKHLPENVYKYIVNNW